MIKNKKISSFIGIVFIALIAILSVALIIWQSNLKIKEPEKPKEQKEIVQQKAKEESNKDLDLILNEIKEKIGLNSLTITPKRIKWNTEKGEITLDGKMYHYTTTLGNTSVSDYFGVLDKFFQQNDFSQDSLNPVLKTQKEELKKYKKGDIVCFLTKFNNPNKTSALEVGCADINDVLYHINSEKAKTCQIDSDCVAKLDTCKCKIVCRNANYKYFDDCNSYCTIEETDFSIQRCECYNNQCVKKGAKK